MSRKKIIAGNWKMNKKLHEAQGLAHEIRTMAQTELMNQAELIIFPSSVYLQTINQQMQGSKIKVGSQNINQNDNGAFTGEISAEMLVSLNILNTLVGHSERRQYYNETSHSCNQKIKQCLLHNIIPYYCVGEILEERENNTHFDVVKQQILEGLEGVSEIDLIKIVIAYEPVWAIGTGKTASAQQANEMHGFIRSVLSDAYTDEAAQKISILYGGSVKADNAKELFSMPNIDGALIGGASLSSRSFIDIAKEI